VTIIYWASGWLFGIWMASILELPSALWAVLGILGLITAVFLHRQPTPFAVAVILSAAALGAARYNLSKPVIDQNHIAYYNGVEDVVVSGLVVKAPDIHETYQNLTVASERIALSDSSRRPVSGRFLLRAARSPIIEYGTRIEAAGRLEEVENSGAFDYQAYLAQRGILAVMNGPWLTQLETGAGNPLMHLLLSIRQRAQESINQMLPQPQAALLSGILLGDDHAIPEELQKDFRDTGMTHIIAISGFNIAIIAGVLINSGKHIVGRRWAAWIAFGAIALYTVFVGAEASVVRASVMAVLFIVAATSLGRPTFTPAALFAAAFFMTLLNPRILWQVGFQLSFAATMGLMLYVGPWGLGLREWLQPHFRRDFRRKATRFTTEFFLTTIAALVMTLPLIIYHFGVVSLVNLPANLLILPAQPGIMTWGGVAVLAGMVSPLLGQIPAWIAWLFLTYSIELVKFFAALPLATTNISLSPFGLTVFYALLFAITWFARTKPGEETERTGVNLNNRQLRFLSLGLLFTVLLAVVWLRQRPDGKLHVSFLDVGQGDAILIESPDGRQMLVDGGEYPSLLLDRIGERLPFWDKTIDLVVATHPDRDHVAGLVDLFESYKVGQVITNGSHEESGTGYFGLVSAAERSETPILGASGGEVIEFGSGVQIEILHAGNLPGSEEDNDQSIVMRLVYEDFSLLLTGDAGHTAEAALIRDGKHVQAVVLKAGHHGSNTASGRDFLQAVNPQIVIISGGGEKYDHPHEAVLQRITETEAAVWRTDELGTIELISDGNQIWSNIGRDSITRR
jgi:competence protein ComEC